MTVTNYQGKLLES